jgi:hypothetical protein
MVVVLQLVATFGGYSVQLVVGQITELAAGGGEGVVELIIRVVRLIDTEYSFQAALIERLIVSHKR